jgi:hypothetical protein
VLITFWGDAGVYVIEDNPNDANRHILRRIDSEVAAEALAGREWRDYVVDYNTAFKALFVEGTPMLPGETINRSMLIPRDILSERAGMIRIERSPSLIERLSSAVKKLLGL